MLDFEVLKLVWWLLIGALLIGFAIMDGHDMGVAMLLPWAGRSDGERRVIINTVGPHWDGNQVWFITAGGALFAAWPLVYATAFSGFYWAMLAVLWALFLRPVGFDFRSKLPDPRWRNFWDGGLFVSGFVPPLIFGVAFGNLLQGVPFEFDAALVPHYTGTFWALLNPFALLAGAVSVAMLLFQGAVYLAHRTDQAVQARARRAAGVSGLLLIAGFALAGLWLARSIPGYAINSALDPGALLDPTAKRVDRVAGAWLRNYERLPLTMLLPLLVPAGVLAALALIRAGRTGLAFIASSLVQLGVIATAGASMFPFMMPSSSHPDMSLTVWDASSSRLTLSIMLWVVVLFLPLILAYTGWAYRVMSGKVTLEHVARHDHTAY